MQNEKTVLVISKLAERFCIEAVAVSDGSIPETLNGESGFHVFHVRILTELILRQLAENGDLHVSEDEITAMAIASSLHDIGKMQIPRAILDHPGKLSPVEYDIVKKHAEFGAEIIEKTDFGMLDNEIKRYAVEIAKYHHERCDGTGYPEGLKGAQVPVSAQAVALADSYDALTSSRSYKEAFSQDVAIQMISSGMCGMFEERFVDALIKVVNHSSLLALRDKLYQKGSIVSEPVGFHPDRVLCIGNTEYLTEAFIKEAFPKSKVTVVGNTVLGSADKIKLFRVKKPSVKAIFETYDFDLVVYFSGDLTYRTRERSDSEELRQVLECAKDTRKEMKVIFLSSMDSAFSKITDRSVLSAAKEELCEFYSHSTKLDIKVVQIPYLYSSTYEKCFLHKLFESAQSKKTTIMDEMATDRAQFLSLVDLSALIYRIVENWKSGGGRLIVNDEFKITFGDICDAVAVLCPGASFDFEGTLAGGTTDISNKGIRNEYGWFSKISLLEDLEEEYEKYLVSKQEKTQTRWQKIRKWLEEHSLFVKIAELIILFLITELFLQLTDSAVIFSVIDFRMVYIVVMATVHGLKYGLYAAGLSSISWLVAKVISGTSLLTIFYEPTNWLAFVFFFLIGALCGYVKLRKDDLIASVKGQNELLEDKLVFTRELYEDTFREKRDLKKQIIGSKDSFGKIFDITRRLNTVEPQLLYLRIMETFEEILENKSITVYSVNNNSTFGRLEVASRDIIDTVSRSISTETYKSIIEKIGNGEVWRNTKLWRDYPMYAAGVYRGEELVLLIFIWQAEIEQRSLYYVNLFKILRDLVQMSLLRAADYNQAVYERQHLANTRIMNADAFAAVLQNYTSLSEKKVSTYILLEVEKGDYTYEELDKLLSGKIRANDIMGIGENGSVLLLLSQATEKDLQYILPRFEGLDVSVTII